MITDEDVQILDGFTPNTADLLTGLLKRDPTERLNAE